MKIRLLGALSLLSGILLSLSVGQVQAQINEAPQANAGPDQFVAPLDFVTLDGSTSFDPEFSPLTYDWSQTLGDLVALSDATAEMPTFTAPAIEQLLEFQLTVTDSEGETSSDTVNINVSTVPLPAAVWLFGAGLAGLVGMARPRRRRV